jgi:BirA family biotin operon repressor/biotin-[acetyl-CoA-carboxylase] ligase
MNIISFTELGSTNDYALSNIVNLHDKDIIIAKKQTKGKGRLGRTWISENEHNLYLTLVLKPNNIDNYILPNITQYMGIVACR